MGLKLFFRALKHRNYRLFFFGQSVSLVGTWMQQIAVSWLVYRITNSPFMLGIVGFVGQLPTFLFAPFAGVVADRYSRYRLVLITQILSMIQAFILAFLVLTHSILIWHIVVLSLFLGIVNSFDITIRQSLTVDMIEDREDLGNAIALNSSMVNMARLLGPSIAGVLIAIAGEGLCFLINAVSYLAVIISLLAMRITSHNQGMKKESIFYELKQGLDYAFNFPPIRYILMLLALVSLMGIPYQVLMPIFARDIFHGGPKTLGFLMASSGIGAFFGAMYLAGRKTIRGLGKAIVLSSALFGMGIAAFSFSRILWLSAALILFSAFGMMVHMASSNTILQTIVEEDKRGRVMSFFTMAFMGMMPFGSLLAGSLASKVGAPNTLLIGGVCCIIGSFMFAIVLPSLTDKIKLKHSPVSYF